MTLFYSSISYIKVELLTPNIQVFIINKQERVTVSGPPLEVMGLKTEKKWKLKMCFGYGGSRPFHNRTLTQEEESQLSSQHLTSDCSLVCWCTKVKLIHPLERMTLTPKTMWWHFKLSLNSLERNWYSTAK